jgi:hypothetical protein
LRTELERTLPGPLSKGFGYIDDFRTWPAWYKGMVEILEPDKGAWRQPGDEVRFAYALLGRRLEGSAVLERKREGELSVFRTRVPGLPTFHFEYHFAPDGPEAFSLKVVMQSEEPAGLLGMAFDRVILPRVVERDLRQSLENLHRVLGARPHKAPRVDRRSAR